ncbi:hypothetical protein ARMGADRAFT_1033062 [Armillaria gallica]|uniref:Uncharacterized protein n=1 Tax=Armillaria gallica TaxID=47427 RepID=A0A2H3DMM3_ARMGA|nr:hypothetical protein ARMGADRAFT_1033062 [Armillaria gallica]
MKQCHGDDVTVITFDHHHNTGTSTLLTLAAYLAMPEIQELYIFHQVRAFWFDCKSLEICKKLVTDEKAVKGHVIPLTFDCAHLTRGSQSNKTVLYPPKDVVLALAQSSTPHVFRDASLVLCNAILDPRFVILDLDTMILKIHKLKVTLALEFKHHVLAFSSYDNNTRSVTEEYYVKHWSYIPYTLRPSSPSFELERYLSEFNETALSLQPYVFVDPLVYYNGFLATVVWFIVLIQKRKQTMVQKHKANHIHSKYLPHVCLEDLEASEWHNLNINCKQSENINGGLSDLQVPPTMIKEKSVGQEKYTTLDLSSRGVSKPIMNGQALYSQHLEVHGQERCFISAREKTLLHEYEVNEFNYIWSQMVRLVIDCPQLCHTNPFHHDVQKWPAPSDPLTQFYLHLAREDPEYLDLKKYDMLEVLWRSWVNTRLYKVNGDALWRLMYVCSLEPICHLKKTVTYIKKHTAKWTVGPMDFCIHCYPAGKRKKCIEKKYQDKWRILHEQDKVLCEEQLQHWCLIWHIWYPFVRSVLSGAKGQVWENMAKFFSPLRALSRHPYIPQKVRVVDLNILESWKPLEGSDKGVCYLLGWWPWSSIQYQSPNTHQKRLQLEWEFETLDGQHGGNED